MPLQHLLMREKGRDQMRSHGMLITILAATLSVPTATCAAAQNAAGAEAQASARSDAAVTDRYLTTVQTELTGKVDSKNAVVGQQVSARTKQAATLANGTTLPKGTRLVGHVIVVQAESEQHPFSVLAMTFDRAELKGGESVALRSVVRMVAPAVPTSARDNTFPGPVDSMGGGSANSRNPSMGGGIDPLGRGPVGVNGPVGGGGPIGGNSPMGGVGTSAGGAGGADTGGDVGMGGGMPGGPVGSGRQIGQIGQRGGSGIGGVNPVTGSIPTPARGNTGTPVAKAGETVSPAPRATALPGVMLSNSGAANASGTLTAAGKNIALESGTQITLGVITR
jgi:hypothetical protein